MTTDYETSVQACDQLGDLAYLSRVPNRITPLKLWEIEHCYRCPVVGMCLPLADQKQFLKRAGYSFRDKTPFEIHELIVASLEDENRLSRKVEKFPESQLRERSALTAPTFSRGLHFEMEVRFRLRRLLGDSLCRCDSP